jgi:3-oxoacyl-[acyl-carrier protein] reductase
MTDRPLEGKTALVTGASRNIGRAIAVTYAQAGANLVLNTLQDKSALDETLKDIDAVGGNYVTAVCDIVDPVAVRSMVKAGQDAFGTIDILVCNASSRGMIDFLELDYETWRRVIDISLDGTYHLAQATLPGMVENGWGRIITLGGISWHTGLKRRAHNLAGKAGLVGLTRALAAEFGDRGITANNISPGHIDTVRPASAGSRPSQAASSPTPVPRMGHVDEIASAALFLADPKQGFITGQIIHVNGGYYMGT